MEEEIIVRKIYPPVKKAPGPRGYKNKKENNMSDNIITAAKMICKSIDALTKEIHLLRKDLNQRDRFESCKEIKSEELEADELDKMPNV